MIAVYLIAAVFLLIFPVMLLLAGLYAVGNIFYLCSRRPDGTKENHPGNP